MEKICTKCNISKSLDEFYKSPKKYNSCGYKPECKVCANSRQKLSYTGEYHKTRLKSLTPEKYQKRSQQLTINAQKRRQDPLIRLKEATRTRIYNALKGNKTKKTLDYLGCSIDEYKNYLEIQFTAEMTWNNWGEYWEIDHKIPLSKGGTFHYLNTQPLIISENRIKSNKLL
jgi:hypothetical protein